MILIDCTQEGNMGKGLSISLVLTPKKKELNASLIYLVAFHLLALDIVFRFIIEYSYLRDFDTYIIGLFLYEDFWRMILWLVLKLEINYRVINIFKDFGFF